MTEQANLAGWHLSAPRTSRFSQDETAMLNLSPFFLTPPGPLGRLPPLAPLPEYGDLSWIFNLLRNSPLAFAARGETVFIHKALFRDDKVPGPLLSAFGISAACASLNDRNKAILFQAVDGQVNGLLASSSFVNTNSTSNTRLLEDLARMQALVLYQIIRLFYGGVEQRAVSEQQAFAVRAQALRLLQSFDADAHIESGSSDASPSPQTWEGWILAESIRRTVFVAFKLYTLYAAFRYGYCVETTALAMLPVSTRPMRAWYSREVYDDWQASSPGTAGSGDTTTMGIFASSMAMRPMTGPLDLDNFERAICQSAGEVPFLRPENVPGSGRLIK
ncbi:hypothetical protein QBC34DRAFT_132288 [Podospora aff. communis PSN243]|uniref:Transcription factor domain-containing protein n=1 Tax=Podospora aff. communis PSN243 TaxID=3040156 RepID=A0AAV9GHZ1_9PEZI|nr:hypothetical protein QBC34DRAFT_132288 [Podospora aff. communis PSN243]